MGYKLFLDDERFPANTGEHWEEIMLRSTPYQSVFSEPLAVVASTGNCWLIARTVEAAQALVDTCGAPQFAMFDHDLGTEQTGLDFAKWLVNRDMNAGGKFFPADFQFQVHSQNVAGAANIQHYIDGYFKQRLTTP